jgi:carbonic anhydrase
VRRPGVPESRQHRAQDRRGTGGGGERGECPPAGEVLDQQAGGQLADGRLFEVAVIHHTQCGTGFLADPGFRHQAAEATGLPEAALEASAVADPHATVKADVDRLLASPLLSPKVSVSGHVYDIATGRVTTTVPARYPQPPRP